MLVIAWERKSPEEAVAAGAVNASEYWPEIILELEKIGPDSAEIVWQWHLWDHIIQDQDSAKPNFGEIKRNPGRLNINYSPPRQGLGGDWTHFNGVSYDPFRDEIILSARNTNEIYIIDHSTSTEEARGSSGGDKGKGGDFLYRWGNTAAYNADQDTQLLFGQHDARVIPEGFADAGAITIFNNGAGRPEGQYSTIELIHPLRNTDGSYQLGSNNTYLPDQSSWQYIANTPDDFYSNNMGGTHPLPNGNLKICESNPGRFFEVSRDRQIVWDYQNTIGQTGPLIQGVDPGGFSAQVFRTTRYPENFSGFEGKDLTPGDPIELNPLPSDCIIYGEEPNAILEFGWNDQLEIWPTITNGEVNISTQSASDYLLDVFTIDGRKLISSHSFRYKTNIDMTNFTDGLYFFLLYSRDKPGHITQKIFKQ